MLNKRKTNRKHLIYYSDVFDNDTGEHIGNLVDISQEGLMLISEKTLEIDKDYNLRIELPAEMLRQDSITIHTTCVRCEQDINPDYNNIGFSFDTADTKSYLIINELLNKYGFQDFG